MTSVYVDADLGDDERRAALCGGDIFIFSPTEATRQLVSLAQDMLHAAFAPHDPRLVHEHLDADPARTYFDAPRLRASDLAHIHEDLVTLYDDGTAGPDRILHFGERLSPQSGNEFAASPVGIFLAPKGEALTVPGMATAQPAPEAPRAENESPPARYLLDTGIFEATSRPQGKPGP